MSTKKNKKEKELKEKDIKEDKKEVVHKEDKKDDKKEDKKEIKEDKKIEEIKKDPNEKHPLQHSWVLYFDSPKSKTVRSSTSSSWGDQMQKVFTFNTVEDFWCLFNNIVSPSKLVHGSNYYLFKEKIEPKWEDEANAHGGSWTFTVQKDNTQNIDTLWMMTALSLIGENLDDGSEVCGAVVSIRNRGDRVSVWTRHNDVDDNQINIGARLKAQLETSLKFEYNLHIVDEKDKKKKAVKYFC